MKYVVDLNGARHTVELVGDLVEFDGESLVARVDDIDGTPVSIVTIGREVHRVVGKRGPSRGIYKLWVDGYRFEGEALDERMRAIRDIAAASAKSTGPAPVVAPMPGLVVRVNVAVGDRVESGQAVVVMEAMKMENELRASSTGIVKAIGAEVGKAVEKGTVLVELEPASD